MARYLGAVVDTDIHHVPTSDREFLDYFPERTRAYAAAAVESGVPFKAARVSVAAPLYNGGNPFRLATAVPESGPAGSSYELVRDQLLDRYDIYRGLLTHDVGEFGIHLNPYFAADLCQAANDWTIERWLNRDDRLYAGIVVSPTLPDEAVREIYRLAHHPRMAFVEFSGTPLGFPAGHPLYHPIYRAATDVGLPIALHVSGSDAPALQAPTGRVSTALEMGSMLGLVGSHYVTSFVSHGVFEKYPTLRVLLIEFALSWLTPLLWNLERDIELLRLESPWVKRRPTEYVHDHLRFSTQPLEAGRPEDSRRLVELLDAVDGIEDLLCFSSDYPHWTMDDLAFVERTLPSSWHSKVFCDNACGLLGWRTPTVVSHRNKLARSTS